MPSTAKPWWKSRTLWLNLLALVVAAGADNVQQLRDALPGGVFAWLSFVLPLANVALRFVTTTALQLRAQGGSQ